MTKIRTSKRLQQILDLLSTQPEVSVSDMTARFAVTAMTIRRDLDTLEKDGQITRTHGGAILTAPSVARFAFQERQQTHLPQKQAIARAATAHIRPGMTIILDTGTTTLEVANALAGTSGLRVLTSSLAIASALFAHDSLELTLLGGTVSRGNPDLTGPLTEENLEAFRADVAFVGADALDQAGLYTSNQAIARVTKAMIASARQTIVVADSSKFGQTAFTRFATWPKITKVIVDAGLTAANQQWLQNEVNDIITVRV